MWVGEPVDIAEAERIEWVPVPRLRPGLLQDEQVLDGLSLTALLWFLAFGPAR